MSLRSPGGHSPLSWVPKFKIFSELLYCIFISYFQLKKRNKWGFIGCVEDAKFRIMFGDSSKVKGKDVVVRGAGGGLEPESCVPITSPGHRPPATGARLLREATPAAGEAPPLLGGHTCCWGGSPAAGRSHLLLGSLLRCWEATPAAKEAPSVGEAGSSTGEGGHACC